jgi:hypothetical protein
MNNPNFIIMKHLILTLSILTGTLLYGQSFFPIPADSTSQWRISRGWTEGNCHNEYNSVYYVDGTIVLNGKEYYSIYETGEFTQFIAHIPPGSCTLQYNYSGVFRGGIRTEHGKVYLFESWQDEEHLQMDFTLGVGDTLSNWGLIVGSIDSVLVGTEYRKRINFSNGDICNWMIEGIGHQAGLFESMLIGPDFFSEFYCYAENNTPLFGDLDCILNVGNAELLNPENAVTVYPNPSEGLLRVEAASASKKIESYRLMDVYGRILTGNIAPKNYNIGFEIDISALPKGVYILIISIENQGSLVKKVIRK